ncbi:hypothetical protein Cgig2_020913 [Carnegiea gigantea]|uniref:peptidylprolyl isomerase n=1 Tax=Carnegiea gigantea TaxID=171969 RepID=A0A9Q1JNW5_9CARY|nr:hypothetical protein Cgig2_020913 [Carnegiea gigantea]
MLKVNLEIPYNEENIRSLAIGLNLNLAAAELKQGKFDNAKTLCSLVLKFEPYNTKALFRRAKAALRLCNIQQTLLDLWQARQIYPTNIEIVKELQKVKSAKSLDVDRQWDSHCPKTNSNWAEEKCRIMPNETKSVIEEDKNRREEGEHYTQAHGV